MLIFEIREGDGNDGTYFRTKIVADDAHQAIRKASRMKIIHKPKDVILKNDIEGDDEHAIVASYVRPIFGDACRWVAEARQLDNRPQLDDETRSQYMKAALQFCRDQYENEKAENPYCHCSHNASRAMEATEKIFTDLGTFGLEGFCDSVGKNGVSYLNTGDSYGLTIVFLSDSEKFEISSWGEIAENQS